MRSPTASAAAACSSVLYGAGGGAPARRRHAAVAVGIATPLFAVALALLGAGNGCVFQLVPLRFQRELGVVTGLVGAAGGLGGFFLPSLLGLLRDHTGSFASGFVLLAFACVWGMTLVVAVSGGWRLTWAAREAFDAVADERAG